MKKNNLFLHIISFSVVFIFVVLLSSSKVAHLGRSYAYPVGACKNMTDSLLTSLENGTEKLTYECFGAVGDGSTNDFDAIKKAHDFANKEYVEKGIFLTVHGTEGKNYYIGPNSSAVIVATSTDFHGANFILDDGGEGVDPTKVLFRVSSPMYVKTGNNSIVYKKYVDMDCLDDDSTCVIDNDVINHNVWKNLYLTTSTKNIKVFVDSVLADTTFMDAASLKYFQSSQIWAVSVTNSNKNYIRSGSNANSGTYQSENILVNRVTGDIIGDIDWNYNDMIQIKVWPIPEKKVVISNGNFTTRTNNIAFDDKGNKTSSSKRNINVSYTGNVTLQDINHYLNEDIYPNNNGQQVNPKANGYTGFIALSNSSYVTIKNVRLTPHTYTKKMDLSDGFATYDLTYTNSINLFFDNVGYACKGEDVDCYNEYMVNDNRWSIIGSNGSKNLFIRNSKLNNIGSHRGLRNLYVENTTVGIKGLTLIGSGSVYMKNVVVDRAGNLVTLRNDYGSTWNGTMIMEDVQYILPSGNGTSNIINSNNNQKKYGYTTYFPDTYMKNVTIDNEKYGSRRDVVLLHLNESSSTSGTSKYKFKGNVRFTNVKFNNSGNNLYLFTDAFVEHDDNLLLNSYSGTSTVEIGYTKNDSSFKLAPSSSSVTKLNNNSKNTKFTFNNSTDVSSTIDSKISSLSNTMAERENSSHMPEALEGDFDLKNILLNYGSISLNEKISADRSQYTADVSVAESSVSLEVQASGKPLSIVYPDKITLTGDTTDVPITIYGIYGTSKTYTLTIRRSLELIKVSAPTKDYCKSLTFNAKMQTLTKGAGEGYTFRGNTAYNAGEYTVTAILKSGYQWSDGTQKEKTFVCKISKATPSVSLTSSSLEIPVNTKKTFVEYASVKGKFQHTSKDEKIASVTPPSTLDIFANSKSTVTVTGVKIASTVIDVQFIPFDTANYETVTKTVGINVKEKEPELKKVEIPSASSCSGAVYNGSEQEIVKAASEGYSFSTTKGKDAGVYSIKATLKKGYVWSDGSNVEKSFQCEIEKATPSISISPTTGDIGVGSTLTITETSSLSGTFENITSNASIATVSPDRVDNVNPGDKTSVTISGVSAGTVSISVRFTTSENKNYKSTAEQTLTFNVTGSSGGGSSGDVSGNGTPGGQKVVMPTAATYCNELTYNGQPQTLTKEAGEGFHFADNVQTDAGEYTIKVALNSGYQWDDETTNDEVIVCTIKKATPVITLNVPNKQLMLNQTTNFTESANVKGTFVNSVLIPSLASISAGEKSEVLTENSPYTVSVSGLLRGLSVIQVDFAPVDAINWESVSKNFRIAINDKMIDNYQDSNANFMVKTDKNYFASESFLYTATDNNNSTIENSLTFKDNVTYEFSDNSLILKDSASGTEKIITLLNIETDFKTENEVMFIPNEMTLEEFKSRIQTNGVTVSVEKIDGDNVTTGTIVNVMYQDQIVDTYVIKIKVPVNQKTGEGDEEDEDFLFGINPILLIVGVVLIVVAIIVLIFSRKKKKPKFIQNGPGDGQNPGAGGGTPPQYDVGQGPNMGPYLQ